MTLIEHLKYSAEERLNVITHSSGCLLALIGGVILLYKAPVPGLSSYYYSLIIYTLASILVFASSAFYHAVAPGRLKERLQKLDHISIFFMIAGTHTPVVIYSFNNSFADYYLIFLWSLVLLGIVYKLFWIDRFERLGLILYILMGWMAVFIFPELLVLLSVSEILLIIGGGLSYSAGIVFYRWHALRYHHAIWHLFVLMGAILHFIAIYSIVLY